jgi:hypothetical protein
LVAPSPTRFVGYRRATIERVVGHRRDGVFERLVPRGVFDWLVPREVSYVS